MRITILFEDESILVIDKPAFFTVNRSETTRNEITIQDEVEKYLQFSQYVNKQFLSASKTESEIKYSEDFIARAGIVHRLDKETSGVLLVAKDPFTFHDLQRQFKERTVQKKYLALVHGKLLPLEGEINVPVGRQEWNRKRFGIIPGGKESITHYRVIKYLQLKSSKELLSLIEIFPKTGRTHQIRVHMKYLNHPIFADSLYAGRKISRNDRKLLSRIFLHASEISFLHPKTKEVMHIKSPLPAELTSFLSSYTEPVEK